MRGITCTIDELLKMRYSPYALDVMHIKKVATTQQGGYLSSLRGRGMDFAESRVYQPGDDVRTIHWNLTAKKGEPYTKVFHPERERPVYVVIDLSASMFFGTRVAFKSVVAAKIAAQITWSVIKKGDRIGAVIFNEAGEYVQQPGSRSRGAIAVLKRLVEFLQPKINLDGKFRFTNALTTLRKIVKPGSVIYVISDFYQLEKEIEHGLRYLARLHEITNILIYDPLEEEMPKKNQFFFCKNKEEQPLRVNTSDPLLCEQYHNLFQQRVQSLQKLSSQYVLKLIKLRTDAPLSHVHGEEIKSI